MELNSGRRYGLVGLNGSGTLCKSGRCVGEAGGREREGGRYDRLRIRVLEIKSGSPCLPHPTLVSGGSGITWRYTNH